MKEINKYIDAREANITKKPIKDRIKWLFNLSKHHSEVYCTSEAYLARKRYLAKHPTMVIVLKCMDGRIHIPYATKTPLGIIKPFRNIGGMFNLGWPYLGEVLYNTVNTAINDSRRVLLLITYHYSKGNHNRGCAGFNHDREAAVKHVFEVKKQVEYIFGQDHQTVYPVVCGFETDEDAMIFHGENKKVANLAEIKDTSKEFWINKLREMYPDMPDRILSDMVPLATGNISHIEDIRNSHRNLELDTVHREWIICVGRGFDFLHVPNIALIIGPYSPDIGGPITKAVGIIKSNMEKGMIPKDGFLLLASSPYNEIGVDRARAELKSQFLGDYASEVIKKAYPEMHKLMVKKTAVLNWHTRHLEVKD
ncbi:MAG TPA: carboxysome shell carbonic anhydrase [Candidatus Moranbacteria bacterium]|nr:carboxysome shell carbonic anhydrase [Candidatus Moranbacteria bacterium]